MAAAKPKAEQTPQRAAQTITLRLPKPINLPWLAGPARETFAVGQDGVESVAIDEGTAVVRFSGGKSVSVAPSGTVLVIW